MKEYKIITLGMAGQNICRSLLSQGYDETRLTHFSTDFSAIKRLNLKDKFFIGEGRVELHNYEAANELFDRYVDLFERAIESDVLYILVSGFGGITGTGFVLNLSKLLTKKNKKFIIIATMPLRFEARRRISRAFEALKELKQQLSDKNLIILPLDDIVTSEMKINEIFDKADQCVVARIKRILDEM